MSSKTAAKTTTTAKKTAPTKETVAAPTLAATTTAPSSKATASKGTASAVVTAAPVAAPVAAAAEDEVSLVTEFNGQVARVNELRNQLGLVLADMKKTEKRLGRELKRAGRRRRVRAPQVDEAGNPLPKKPSVFTKPQVITDALCVFLGKPKGTLVSRSDVTRGIMEYVKKNGLNNKQDINPDAALRKLLAVTEAEKVTILNLQRYLKGHYVKPVVPTA
jgi:chromatin remodeling complex protein RSC6